jgi:hypothetical protein
MSNEVCCRAKAKVGFGVGRDLIDGCLFVFSSDENHLPSSTDPLNELDVVYTRRVL